MHYCHFPKLIAVYNFKGDSTTNSDETDIRPNTFCSLLYLDFQVFAGRMNGKCEEITETYRYGVLAVRFQIHTLIFSFPFMYILINH